MLLAACASGASVTGVVVDMDGDLTSVRSFVLRTADAEELTFVPAPGLEFDGAPLSHLRDHLRAGDTIRVDFEDDGGVLVAVRVTDA